MTKSCHNKRFVTLSGVTISEHPCGIQTNFGIAHQELFISSGGVRLRRVRHELRRDGGLARGVAPPHECDWREQEAIFAQVRGGAKEEEVEEHWHQARWRRYAQGDEMAFKVV